MTTLSISNELSNEQVADEVHRALAPLDAVPMDQDLESEPSIGRLRRMRRNADDDDVGVLTLMDVDGVLLWQEGAISTAGGRYRRRASTAAVDGKIVTQLKYEKPLGFNKIGEKLRKLDSSLTPNGPAKLIAYDPATWRAQANEATPLEKGRILLFVHGTFSNVQNIIDDLRGDDPASGPGAQFLQSIASQYDQILGFDHYTLSRTPLLNAIDLGRLLANSCAAIDIVCHSRGGLVTRWFSEHFAQQSTVRRVVLVGCPLQGTSFADPQSLRNGLTLLTNVGKLLGATCKLVPLLAAAGGLLHFLSWAGSLVGRAPLVDAGVGLVPGLAAMSRIVNNSELEALNHGPAQARPNYHAVLSNFNAEAAGWKFWKLFNKLNVADTAADYLVFKQENDLVVDTTSMTHHAFGDTPDLANLDLFCCFDGDRRVHHTSYFQDAATLEFIRRSFKLA